MTAVSEIMSAPAVVVDQEAYLEEVDRVLQDRGVSAVGVTDDLLRLCGVVSRTDLIRQALAIHRHRGEHTLVLPQLTAEEAMTADPVHVSSSAAVTEAARHMVDHGIHRVFVLEGGTLAGVVATREIMVAAQRDALQVQLARCMSTDVLTVPVTAPMGEAVERIATSNKHGLVVLKDDLPVGIVTTDDVLVAQHWPPSTSVEDWMSPRALCLPGQMPLHLAAAHALAWDVRHIIVMDGSGMIGLVTGSDFARAYADAA